MEFETTSFWQKLRKTLSRVNLLRWSLKLAQRRFAACDIECKFTPMEFETPLDRALQIVHSACKFTPMEFETGIRA